MSTVHCLRNNVKLNADFRRLVFSTVFGLKMGAGTHVHIWGKRLIIALSVAPKLSVCGHTTPPFVRKRIQNLYIYRFLKKLHSEEL